MITDKQTNFLYLADSLRTNFPTFYQAFEKLLKESNVEFALLPDTKDIWAVDYMPIQVSDNRFVQFKYNPDYLRNSQIWSKTISDTNKICDAKGIKRESSSIILDGGNVIKGNNTVIMCDKVFRENPGISKSKLIVELHELFEVEKIVFVPQDPDDFTGHADGMVRFVDDKTVIVNAYPPNYRPMFQKDFRASLHNAGFDCREISYSPDESSNDSAKGLYINYLQMENVIIVPTFGATDYSNPWHIEGDLKDDECAIMLMEQLFENYIIKIIDCKEIAPHGGVLNCISWNIKK